MADEIHELTAAYALDALAPDERAAYEEHLRECDACRRELRELADAAALLAYAVPPAAPPAGLRERILEQASSGTGNVVPLRRPRRAYAAAAAAAAVLVAGVAGLGIWAATLEDELDETRAALEVVGDPGARLIPLDGAEGRLVVTADGRAALVLQRLPAAPPGKTYEIWVIEQGEPEPAGLFEGGGAREIALLTTSVPASGVVAVTVERDGGVSKPTGEPIFRARL